MEGDRRLSLVVGVFVLVTLGVFAAAILSLTEERGFWVPRYRLVTYFENVQGLINGAPVRLAGTDVGTVESVSFGPLGGEKPPVQVALLVESAVRDRIRSDSVASIGTIGLLGDRYVEITMGSQAGTVLQEGAELASVTPLDIAQVMAQGNQALSGIADLANNVNQVVTDFQGRMGGGRVAESVEAFSQIAEQMTAIAKEVTEGDGLLHSLIYDRYEGSGVESIEQSLATFENILWEIRHGDGVLHTLIYESPTEQDLVMQALEAGARLNSILAKVDRGEGTLGLLVSDPTLYEDLKLLVGGARRSLVVRSLIRLAGDEN